MKKGMLRKIIKIWDWLIFDFERLIFSIYTGGLSLQVQTIPVC